MRHALPMTSNDINLNNLSVIGETRLEWSGFSAAEHVRKQYGLVSENFRLDAQFAVELVTESDVQIQPLVIISVSGASESTLSLVAHDDYGNPNLAESNVPGLYDWTIQDFNRTLDPYGRDASETVDISHQRGESVFHIHADYSNTMMSSNNNPILTRIVYDALLGGQVRDAYNNPSELLNELPIVIPMNYVGNHEIESDLDAITFSIDIIIEAKNGETFTHTIECSASELFALKQIQLIVE